jgi:flagellar hook-length control protein FliK
MVLAQMLMPSQAGTGNLDPAAAGALKGSTSDAPGGIQVIDPIEENAPAFGSLLTELKNLEVLGEQASSADPNTLIKIRIETGPGAAGAQTEERGTNLPAAGKVLPDAATLPVRPGLSARPLEPVDPASTQAMLPSSELQQAELQMEIVVQEPKSSEMRITATSAAEGANAIAKSGGVEVAAMLQSSSVPPASSATISSSAPTSAAPTATSPAVTGNTDAPLRAEGLMPTTTANATGSGVQMSGGSASGGEQQGEQQGERQTQANPASRGPIITFSLESTPTAILAAPTASATAASGFAQVLSQPLALLGQPAQWAQPLAERLAGLATRGANTAEIRLHPPSLGALEVRITVANDQASIFVASANPEVREALQQAMPRLDDLLSGLGIELAESEIAERHAEGFQANADGRQSADPEAAAEQGAELRDEPTESRLGLLDTWA